MENNFETSLTKIIGSIKRYSITRQIFTYTFKTNHHFTESKRKRVLSLEDVLEVIDFGGFSWDFNNSKLYYQLTETEYKYLNTLKGKILSSDEINFINNLIEGDNSLFIAIQEKESLSKDSALEKIAEILVGRTAEELEIAKDILYNDRDYKYKSDKVKAYLKGSIRPDYIVNILSLRKETVVNLSYVESIKKQLN